MKLPAKAIAQLASLAPLAVEVGDVFRIPEPLAAYYESPKARPALVVRVQRSTEASVAHLVYGTSKPVASRRAMPVPAGEAGLRLDTNFDFGPQLELSVLDLATHCTPLGRLGDAFLEELERSLRNSMQPCRRLPR